MISIFEGLPVDAGFTTKPADGKAHRDSLKERGTVARLALCHGNDIAVIRSADPGGVTPPRAYWEHGYLTVDDVDGAVTDVPGLILATTHGDCLPIWLCDPSKGVVALAHAGWRGTLAGIAGSLAQACVRAYGCRPEDLKACIGPGIAACCFEVGFNVADAFTDKYPWAEEYVYCPPGRRPHVDLKGINAELLALEGVTETEVSAHCTCCEPDLFWSHRRCADKTRMLAYIAWKGYYER
jgi:YfiH family protein